MYTSCQSSFGTSRHHRRPPLWPRRTRLFSAADARPQLFTARSRLQGSSFLSDPPRAFEIQLLLRFSLDGLQLRAQHEEVDVFVKCLLTPRERSGTVGLDSRRE